MQMRPYPSLWLYDWAVTSVWKLSACKCGHCSQKNSSFWKWTLKCAGKVFIYYYYLHWFTGLNGLCPRSLKPAMMQKCLESMVWFPSIINPEECGPFINRGQRDSDRRHKCLDSTCFEFTLCGAAPGCLVYMLVRQGSILSAACCKLGHVCFIFNAWPGT